MSNIHGTIYLDEDKRVQTLLWLIAIALSFAFATVLIMDSLVEYSLSKTILAVDEIDKPVAKMKVMVKLLSLAYKSCIKI